MFKFLFTSLHPQAFPQALKRRGRVVSYGADRRGPDSGDKLKTASEARTEVFADDVVKGEFATWLGRSRGLKDRSLLSSTILEEDDSSDGG